MYRKIAILILGTCLVMSMGAVAGATVSADDDVENGYSSLDSATLGSIQSAIDPTNVSNVTNATELNKSEITGDNASVFYAADSAANLTVDVNRGATRTDFNITRDDGANTSTFFIPVDDALPTNSSNLSDVNVTVDGESLDYTTSTNNSTEYVRFEISNWSTHTVTFEAQPVGGSGGGLGIGETEIGIGILMVSVLGIALLFIRGEEEDWI
jgi:hypothetical protein